MKIILLNIILFFYYIFYKYSKKIFTWAEYIIHSNKTGKFKELIIDDDFAQKHVVECDLWVNKDDEVHDFTGANETIGTLVLKFDGIEEARVALKNMKKYIKVMVE